MLLYSFTKPIGKYGSHDECFCDVKRYRRGHVRKQMIRRINKIEIYSDTTDDPDAAVIVGLKVQYQLKDGTTTPLIAHGIVNATKVGEFMINEDQLLVSVYGQLKSAKNSANGERIASISFTLFNKKTAMTEIKGPYCGSNVRLGRAWAHFGNIIAFRGTKVDGVGLTSLCFFQTRIHSVL